MNKIISIAILCLGLVSASFTKDANWQLDIVYYDDPDNGCTQARATHCPFIGYPNCVVPIFDLQGSPLGFSAQVYQSQHPQNPTICVNPYGHPH